MQCRNPDKILAWMWHVLISAAQTFKILTLCVFMVTVSCSEQKPCPSHLSKPALTPLHFHIILPCQVQATEIRMTGYPT